MAEPVRLLVVCLGNICRSPMAEGALRRRLAEAGLDHVEVDSVGTSDWHVGNPPDPRAIATAARHGVDLSGLRARQLSDADYTGFDWLLSADLQNLADVRARRPADAAAGIALLTEWAGVKSGDGAIPDPYTGGDDHFEEVWQVVEAVARGAVRRLQAPRNGFDA
ncbi:low molecular weight phosphotyrosine protein phosphatase [Luteimonas yindakuii]|uniref:low molecular weight protein-tyrosine-phosphatase n=1 Tax=Luteimonas yindakuii TaxID=2565782 RepID=UPI0010A30B13|nr:low molecular weight protein-tyrosine-phosphatase [Luteimonas yindakuii]QCO67428.1 low molecular weight phosphotyrosine protein phosphatase [Luteimonas yindakuii]